MTVRSYGLLTFLIAQWGSLMPLCTCRCVIEDVRFLYHSFLIANTGEELEAQIFASLRL